MEVVWSPTKLDFPHGLDAWVQSVKSKIQSRIFKNLNSDTDNLDRYIELIEVEGLPGAILACAFYQHDMNLALTRMGLYMGAGKGHARGTLVSAQDPVLLNYLKLVAGHNLPGPLIREFASKADLNPAESALIERLGSPEDFYLIAFSIQNMKSHQNVVSHEIFHAQRFLSEDYRRVTLQFWREAVSAEDRKLAREILGQVYNVDDEDLIVDEFQAYVLQSESAGDRLGELAKTYGGALRARLERAGIKLFRL